MRDITRPSQFLLLFCVSLFLIAACSAADIPIEFGRAVTGTVTGPGENVNYTFTGTAGDWIFASGVLNSSGLPRTAQIFGPDGSSIGSFVSINGHNDEECLVQLPTTGLYSIQFVPSYYDRPIGYGLYVQRVNNPGNAGSIAYGMLLTGSIDILAHFDTYTFSAQAGDPIHARLFGTKAFDINEIQIYAPNGTLLASDFQLSYAEHIRDVNLVAPVTGTYTLLVGERVLEYSGLYGLYLQRCRDPVNAAALEYGAIFNGSFTTLGEMDAYTFTGTAGEEVFGRAGSQWGQWDVYAYPWLPGFILQIQVYDPNGALLGTYDFDGGAHSAPEFTLQLPISGTYTVLVANQETKLYYLSEYVGDYGVMVQRLSDPNHATPITDNTPVTASIAAAGEFDTYTFAAEEGDAIFAQASPQFHRDWNSIDLRLYAPNGTLLAAPSGGPGTVLEIPAPTTGVYVLIVAESPGSQTGPYTFSVANRPPVALSVGQTVRGNISASPGDRWDYYYCAGIPAGEELLVQVIPVIASTSLEFYGGLNHAPTADSFDFVQKEKNSDGIYEIRISPTANGTYWFGVYCAGGSTSYSIRAGTGGGSSYVANIYPTIVDQSPDTRIHVYGFGFVPGMQVRLARNGTAIATARTALVASPTTIISTFDLSSVALDTYDVVVEWPDHAVDTVPSLLQVRGLPGGVLYQEKDLSFTSGQTKTIPILVPSTRNLFVTLQKIGYGGDPHFNWEGTLTVTRDGIVVGTDSGNQDQLIHLVNPSPGSYTISVNADSEAGQAILTVWDELPVLTPGEWVVEKIPRPYGSVFKQIDLPLGQDTLKLQAQAIGDLSRFKIYNGQWGSGPAWISSLGPDASLTIDDPPPGLYIVEFMDTQMVTGMDQARDVMLQVSITDTFEPPLGYLPVIASLSPTKGGNSGNVTIGIEGAWLNNHSTISLVRSGYPDISASTVTESDTGTKLDATFNLIGSSPGDWDLTIEKPDGQVISAPFTIVEGGEPELQAELLAPSTVRAGRISYYYWSVRNTGLIDAEDVMVEVNVTEVDPPQPITSALLQEDENPITISGITNAAPGPFGPGGGSTGIGSLSSGGKEVGSGIIDRRYESPYIKPCDMYKIKASTSTAGSGPRTRVFTHQIPARGNESGQNDDTCGICNGIPSGDDVTVLNGAASSGSSGGTTVCPVNSVDPENMYGIAGYGPSHMVKNDQPLSYRVDFWNAENATADVMDVQAYNRLDSNLDLPTFGFSEVGFTNWSVPLDGAPSFDVYVDTRPEMPYIVHITGDMDLATGKATLEYHTLDATTLEPPEDTTVGFLPPIASNEIGWFAYSVSPKPDLASGTVIENQAFVNFDYTQYFPAPPNAPWRNTLDAGAPTSRVNASLANGTEIRFMLSGTDDAGGSGVQDYTIYASDNGGAYKPFLSGVIGSSAVAFGEANHTYRFFSIGQDNVGHIEAMKSAPEATVVVSPAQSGVVTVPGGTGVPRDLNGDGRYEDINGNGRKDFADVVLYFNQMSWIATNEPAGALDFDYNENDRIDFADVVWLFNHL